MVRVALSSGDRNVRMLAGIRTDQDTEKRVVVVLGEFSPCSLFIQTGNIVYSMMAFTFRFSLWRREDLKVRLKLSEHKLAGNWTWRQIRVKFPQAKLCPGSLSTSCAACLSRTGMCCYWRQEKVRDREETRDDDVIKEVYSHQIHTTFKCHTVSAGSSPSGNSRCLYPWHHSSYCAVRVCASSPQPEGQCLFIS